MLGESRLMSEVMPEWLAIAVRNRIQERLSALGEGNYPADLSELGLDELVRLGQDRGLVAIPPPLPTRSDTI